MPRAVLSCAPAKRQLPWRPRFFQGVGHPAMSKESQPVFRIIFNNQGQVFELYAQQIFQSELWGFMEIEELIFGERSQLVVDPGEEKLKNQFDGVKRSFIPVHSIIRIDEVERVGTAKISEAKGDSGSNVMHFPMPPRSDS